MAFAESKFQNPVIRWIDTRLPIFTMMHHEYAEFPMPKNVNYLWAFGALAMIVMIIMILTGIFLVMQYTPNTTMAFDSIERIMRDVNYGWLIRYIHANGASMFFFVVYVHMFRGLYYGSYKSPRELVWILGVLIIILMMATAFMGYVLVWGQMSFWGATVITNLFSAIPVVGDPIVTLLWGGFSVDNPTLNRFFSLHYLLPFVIFAVVMLHATALHIVGSNNPTGIDIKDRKTESVPFHPYVTMKDLFAVTVFLLIYSYFVFFNPNYLGHPDNYTPANPMVTPAHIVPEWYLLPFYAILRAIPDKLGGVIAMGAALVVLFFLPWLDTAKTRGMKYRFMSQFFFWVLAGVVIMLGYCGASPPEGKWVIMSQAGTIYYFAYFLILMPVLGWVDKPRKMPSSITEAISQGNTADGGKA